VLINKLNLLLVQVRAAATRMGAAGEGSRRIRVPCCAHH
jgi:hypothetical protein